MSSIYIGGYTASTHIHKLVCIYQPPYRYRCVECNAHLQRKSGVMVKDDKKCK